jgi:N-acyl-D-aspartate/D-glutamate deacylase
MNWQGTFHPFLQHKAYKAIAHLPANERLQRLRDPEVRARIVTEVPEFDNPFVGYVMTAFGKMFPLGDPPDYEPAPERSVAAMAQREGRTPQEVVYDLLMQRGGRELVYLPLLNYSDGDFGPIREMLLHPNTVMSLSDGGAHCGVICDAGTPTFLLTHWVRDRKRGERLPLEFMVRRQTAETAALYGLHDRGLLVPGKKADINVIDFDRLRLMPPEMVFDLPASGRRLIQKADGYRATIKSGRVTFEGGDPTGALPGKLLRGAQAQ